MCMRYSHANERYQSSEKFQGIALSTARLSPEESATKLRLTPFTPSYAHVVFSCECERSIELKGMRRMERTIVAIDGVKVVSAAGTGI
jgi:hypothetical protein